MQQSQSFGRLRLMAVCMSLTHPPSGSFGIALQWAPLWRHLCGRSMDRTHCGSVIELAHRRSQNLCPRKASRGSFVGGQVCPPTCNEQLEQPKASRHMQCLSQDAAAERMVLWACATNQSRKNRIHTIPVHVRLSAQRAHFNQSLIETENRRKCGRRGCLCSK